MNARLALVLLLLSPSAFAKGAESRILAHQGSSFEELSKSIQKGATSATPAELLRLARNRSKPDPARYKALAIAASLLPAAKAETELKPFLKDPSWMLRSMALRELEKRGSAAGGVEAMRLLRDPAWVIRSQAVRTVASLKPPGALPALLVAAADASNFHGGRAQWVAYRALDAALALNPSASELSPLRPALERGQDETYLKRVIAALEKATGKTLPSSKKSATSVLAKDWARELGRIASNDAGAAARVPAATGAR